MTITQTDSAPPEWHSWTRRTWLLIWAAVAAVVLLAAGLIVNAKLQSLDDEYGPLSSGPFGGTTGSPGIAYGHDRMARLVTKGNATTYVYGSMDIDGSHSVRVTGFELDDVTVEVRWAPMPSDDVAIPQIGARWRTFPATIAANTQLQMRYTIRRPPHCQDKPMRAEGGQVYSNSQSAHWESLLGEHSTEIDNPLEVDYLQVC